MLCILGIISNMFFFRGYSVCSLQKVVHLVGLHRTSKYGTTPFWYVLYGSSSNDLSDARLVVEMWRKCPHTKKQYCCLLRLQKLLFRRRADDDLYYDYFSHRVFTCLCNYESEFSVNANIPESFLFTPERTRILSNEHLTFYSKGGWANWSTYSTVM